MALALSLCQLGQKKGDGYVTYICDPPVEGIPQEGDDVFRIQRLEICRLS